MFNLFVQTKGVAEANRIETDVYERLNESRVGSDQDKSFVAQDVIRRMGAFRESFENALRYTVMEHFEFDIELKTRPDNLKRNDIMFRYTPRFILERLELPEAKEGVFWYDIERFKGLYFVSSEGEIFSPRGKLVRINDELRQRARWSRYLEPFQMFSCKKQEYFILKDLDDVAHVYEGDNLIREAKNDLFNQDSFGNSYWGKTGRYSKCHIDLVGWMTLHLHAKNTSVDQSGVEAVLSVAEKGEYWDSFRPHLDKLYEYYREICHFSEYGGEPFLEFYGWSGDKVISYRKLTN